jgi:hypothetical protein
VVGTCRGEGVATALAKAVRERWPDLTVTPLDEEEWRLLHALGFDPGRALGDQLQDFLDGESEPGDDGDDD